MKFWYRTMVAVIAAAAVFCTTAVVWAGCGLWKAAQEQELLCDGERFQWHCGRYEAEGWLENGVLEEMTIERTDGEP